MPTEPLMAVAWKNAALEPRISMDDHVQLSKVTSLNLFKPFSTNHVPVGFSLHLSKRCRPKERISVLQGKEMLSLSSICINYCTWYDRSNLSRSLGHNSKQHKEHELSPFGHRFSHESLTNKNCAPTSRIAESELLHSRAFVASKHVWDLMVRVNLGFPSRSGAISHWIKTRGWLTNVELQRARTPRPCGNRISSSIFLSFPKEAWGEYRSS